MRVNSIYWGLKGELCLSDRIREKEGGACWRKVLEECLPKKKNPYIVLWTTPFSKYTNQQLFTNSLPQGVFGYLFSALGEALSVLEGCFYRLGWAEQGLDSFTTAPCSPPRTCCECIGNCDTLRSCNPLPLLMDYEGRGCIVLLELPAVV